ncbi:hypothetical protein AB0D38_05390 [Streptomyces sp. NPDC048279]
MPIGSSRRQVWASSSMLRRPWPASPMTYVSPKAAMVGVVS